MGNYVEIWNPKQLLVILSVLHDWKRNVSFKKAKLASDKVFLESTCITQYSMHALTGTTSTFEKSYGSRLHGFGYIEIWKPGQIHVLNLWCMCHFHNILISGFKNIPLVYIN